MRKGLRVLEASMTIFVALSGGLDSTWVLWHLLSTTRIPIVTFHLRMISIMNRHVPEERAVDSVVAWCGDNVRPVEALEKATLDMGDMIGWMDGPLIAAPIVAAMMGHPDADTIATGRCIDEKRGFNYENFQPSMPGFNKLALLAWFHTAMYVGKGKSRNGRELKIIEPAIDCGITKLGMRDQMPRDLYNMTWSCHRPSVTRSGFAPCETCLSCRLREGRHPNGDVDARRSA